MANDKLFIPDKIKVGYQKREDTYNGNLAYVIYYDKKGVLRKETSWSNWRDNKIDPDDFDNEPTEGFVLNKDVGGKRHNYHEWNPRNEAIRVYDPRGFEFEISLPNLLFILKESVCNKGKGLEGKFVYAWDGTELVLLPVGCEEHKKSIEFSNLKSTKSIPVKELKYGATYRDSMGSDWVYLGKLDCKKKVLFLEGELLNKNTVSVPCFVSLEYKKSANRVSLSKDTYAISFKKSVCLKVSDESLHKYRPDEIIQAVQTQDSRRFKDSINFDITMDSFHQSVFVKDNEYYVIDSDGFYTYTPPYQNLKKYDFDNKQNYTRYFVKSSYRIENGIIIEKPINVYLMFDDQNNYYDHPDLAEVNMSNSLLSDDKREEYIDMIKRSEKKSLRIKYKGDWCLYCIDNINHGM